MDSLLEPANEASIHGAEAPYGALCHPRESLVVASDSYMEPIGH